MSGHVRGNTLFATSEGALLRTRNFSLQLVVDGRVAVQVPLHHLHSVAVFGNATVTSAALARCAEAGISVTFLDAGGRLRARVDAPQGGNVLLRREQYRLADDEKRALAAARSFAVGKLNNQRNLLLHAARDAAEGSRTRAFLRQTAELVRARILGAAAAETADELRGQEGIGTRVYFNAFTHLVHAAAFQMQARTRRPPRDPLNAMLSFTYALLTNDCVAALTTSGLDPAVGFFHRDRPGRPGLALDLMEEFRPVLADRTVLALVNRHQIDDADFEHTEGGGVLLSAGGRRILIEGYHGRRLEEATHPLLGERATLGEFPFLQARLLARHVRGELPTYPPVVLR
ncbi:MAG: type I-C CRISPR-associated endonuclease Cas1 [Dehalococcoidia bacterium]|nr:type I-C CRISPR-associated endonuclease Cas1 [Dehalococcoidia bacterium]